MSSRKKEKNIKVAITLTSLERDMLALLCEKEGYMTFSSYFSHKIRNDFNEKYTLEEILSSKEDNRPLANDE